MAYEFSNQGQATFKIKSGLAESTVSFKNISSTENANVVISGISSVMAAAYGNNWSEIYYPTEGVRTVSQNVNEST